MSRGLLAQIACTLAVLCPASSALSDNPDFTTWWNRYSEFVRSDVGLNGLHIEWTSTIFEAVPTAAKIAELRARVAGKPDHPDRSTLSIFEQMFAKGPPTSTTRVWASPDGRYVRQALDLSLSPSQPVDLALFGERSWTMSAQALTLRARHSSSQNHDTGKAIDNSTKEARMFLVGGWSTSAFRSVVLEPPPTLKSNNSFDGQWILRDPGGDITLSMTGEFDPLRKQGRLLRITSTLKSSGSVRGWTRTTVCSDWTILPQLIIDVPRRIQSVGSDGAILTQSDLSVLEAIDSATAERFAAIPELESTDPVRGIPTYTEIHDDTGSTPMLSTRADNGDMISTPAVPVGTPTGAGSRVLIAGWVFAGLVLVVLVIVHRRSSAQKGLV